MPNTKSGLHAQPFNEIGQALTFVRSQPQHDALQFMEKSIADLRGVALLHGEDGVGKTTLVRHFAEQQHSQASVAYVNGEGLYASQLLSRILAQYGYDVSLSSTEELLNMLQIFLVQQARIGPSPLLIIDNLNRMFPGALNALCAVASYKARDRYAMRMILVSNTDSRQIINSPSMAPVANRISGAFEVRPLTAQESNLYLYTKLRAAGAAQPDDLLSVDVCDKLFAESGGVPGRLDRAAAHFLENGELLNEAPRLIVTRDGAMLQDVELLATRLLVGRSELSDIMLSDQYVSKHHALLIWNDDAVVLVDLRSSNGTFVNSRRIKTQVLHHNDVVSLGDHRIKLVYQKAGVRADLKNADLADTAKMKNIADARRARAVRNVAMRAVDIG